MAVMINSIFIINVFMSPIYRVF